MTRSRLNITQADIDNVATIRRQASKLRGAARVQRLKDALIAELSLQKEADWELQHSFIAEKAALDTDDAKISYTLKTLLDIQDAYNSEEEFYFVKKWGMPPAAFPRHWHAFVKDFMEAKQAGKGGRALVEFKQEFDDGVREEEASFWKVKNLCDVFLHYMAALSDVSDWVGEREQILEFIIPELPLADDDKQLLFDQFHDDSLRLIVIRQKPSTIEELQDEDPLKPICKAWRAFHLSVKDSSQFEKRVLQEWKRQLAVVVTKPTKESKRLFAGYCDAIEGLYEDWQQAKTPVVRNTVERDSLAYVASGAGIGLSVAGGVIAGLLLAGVVTCTLPLILGMVGLTIGFAALGGVLGNRVKTYLDNRDAQAEEGVVAATSTTGSSISQTCSMLTCALLLGPFSCCLASTDDLQDQRESAPPLTQIDDDYDAREEAEVPSVSSKVGLSS